MAESGDLTSSLERERFVETYGDLLEELLNMPGQADAGRVRHKPLHSSERPQPLPMSRLAGFCLLLRLGCFVLLGTPSLPKASQQ